MSSMVSQFQKETMLVLLRFRADFYKAYIIILKTFKSRLTRGQMAMTTGPGAGRVGSSPREAPFLKMK